MVSRFTVLKILVRRMSSYKVYILNKISNYLISADKNSPSEVGPVIRAALIPGILAVLILATVLISFLVAILCYCHFRGKRKSHERADTRRDDEKQHRCYIDDLNLAMEGVREQISSGKNSENMMMELMTTWQGLLQALVNSRRRFPTAISNNLTSPVPNHLASPLRPATSFSPGGNTAKESNVYSDINVCSDEAKLPDPDSPDCPDTRCIDSCDGAPFVEEDGTEIMTPEVAALFASCTNSMLCLGLGTHSLKLALKGTLQDMKELDFMKTSGVQE